MTDIVLQTKDYLAASTAITRHVGTRIYPGVLPLDALSAASSTQGAIALRVIGGENVAHLNGYAGTGQDHVQVDTQAKTHIAREAIDEQVRLRMAPSFLGTYGSVFVSGIHQEGDLIFLEEQPDDGSDDWRYRAIRTFLVTYSEATSTG